MFPVNNLEKNEVVREREGEGEGERGGEIRTQITHLYKRIVQFVLVINWFYCFAI